MFNAIFLITIGSLLFLNNFGILPWTIWLSLYPFWPVLIIFAGIDAIFSNSKAGKIIAGLINTVIFIAIVAKVVGLDYPLINKIPLPERERNRPEFLFTDNSFSTNKHDVRLGLIYNNFTK